MVVNEKEKWEKEGIGRKENKEKDDDGGLWLSSFRISYENDVGLEYSRWILFHEEIRFRMSTFHPLGYLMDGSLYTRWKWFEYG